MKILALDIGDQWTGSAISDALGMFARPYQTVETAQLSKFLITTFEQEGVKTVIIGYPKTMRGNQSDQTKKVELAKQNLEKEFPTIEWISWDERLSSKRADSLKKARTPQEKRQSHSIAAAFILSSYLDHLKFKDSLLD